MLNQGFKMSYFPLPPVSQWSLSSFRFVMSIISPLLCMTSLVFSPSNPYSPIPYHSRPLCYGHLSRFPIRCAELTIPLSVLLCYFILPSEYCSLAALLIGLCCQKRLHTDTTGQHAEYKCAIGTVFFLISARC